MNSSNRTSSIRYSFEINKKNEEANGDHSTLFKKNIYASSISFMPKQFRIRFSGLYEKNTKIKSSLNELKAIDSCKIQTAADHHRHNYKEPFSFYSNLNLKEKTSIKESRTTPYYIYYNSFKKTTNAQSVPKNEVSMVNFNDLNAKSSISGSITNLINGEYFPNDKSELNLKLDSTSNKNNSNINKKAMMNTPNSNNNNNNNNKITNETLEEEFTQNLKILEKNEQLNNHRSEEQKNEVKTTQQFKENYVCNNQNIHEDTNHTRDNLLTNINTIISIDKDPNNNNFKDLNSANEIGAREELSNNSLNKSEVKINNYLQNELQPTLHDPSSSNDNKNLPTTQNPKLYSSSINQLYLNKNNISNEIDSINQNNDINNTIKKFLNIIKSVGSRDDCNNLPKTENIKSNLITVKTLNKQDTTDLEKEDELKNSKEIETNNKNPVSTSNSKKFNLPNFCYFENTSNYNNNLLYKENQTSVKTELIISNNPNRLIDNRIASPLFTSHNNNLNKIQSHNFDLMHQSSFSSTSSSPPPHNTQTTSVFDSSGLVEARGTFSATPAGVKSLTRKNEINSELFSLDNILTTSKTTNRSGLSTESSSGFNVNNKNIINNAYSSSNKNNNNFNSATMFHPTWDEWKRSHLNEKNNLNNNNLNESISFTKTSSDNFSNKQKTKNESNDNKNTFNTSDSIEKNTTTRSFIEETIRHRNKTNANQEQQQEHQQHYHNANTHSVPYQIVGNTKTDQYFNSKNSKNSNQKSSGMYFSNSVDVYNPPSPIVINDNSETYSKRQHNHEQTHSSKREQLINQTKKTTTSNLKSTNHSPRHYPVYPFDAQPNRAPSPVRLSSIVLAKQPPIEVEIKDFKIEPPPQPEPQQPKKIKTIMSTQKRKESAPNLTGWRTESDSDTEIQNRLLAKASGSIPIEYISIRRDPKPNEKRPEKNKKSITTGTNTSTERGKRIASTNTNQDELPQYNLHVSLDSLFVKSRKEASTSTERKNKNAATETEIKQRDACTVTDAEEEPEPPPPPPQQYCYRSRKSRYTEWETASTPPEPTYRLEFLTKSPRVVHRRNFMSNQHVHAHERIGCLNDDDNDLSDIFNNNIMVDDDDRIIFGSSATSAFNHSHHSHHNNHHHHHRHEHHSCKRSGSFPNLLVRPVPIIVDNGVQTKRYIKHTHSTTHTPIIQQQTFSSFSPQIGLLPLRNSNGCLNNENWNSHFDVFNSKFSEVFGGHQNFVHNIEPKTERYYKFSRTTSENQHHPVPSFGEIYQRHNLSSSRAQQHYESNNQFNTSQQVRSPIVEMPSTPESTIGRKRFFSSSSSTAGGYGNMATSKNAYSSGYNSFSQCGGASTATSTSGIGGPINTISPTPILVNHENKDYSASSSYQKTFDPIVKQSHNYSTSSTTKTMTNSYNENALAQKTKQKTHGFNKEEEEEELFNLASNHQVDSDKQFRPIYQPIVNETNSFTPTTTTPIPVINSSNNKSKRHNYSTSSYEYSESQGTQPNQKWSNAYPQRLNSTQTISN